MGFLAQGIGEMTQGKMKSEALDLRSALISLGFSHPPEVRI